MKTIPEIAVNKPWLRNQRIAGRGRVAQAFREIEREMRPFLMGVIIGAISQLLYTVFKLGVVVPRLWR